jgi:hypothetical protein
VNKLYPAKENKNRNYNVPLILLETTSEIDFDAAIQNIRIQPITVIIVNICTDLITAEGILSPLNP